MAFQSSEQASAYWRENVSLMLKLLAIWFAVSFGAGILFVDALNAVQFFGFKLGFWFAQQGSIYIFVVIVSFETRMSVVSGLLYDHGTLGSR